MFLLFDRKEGTLDIGGNIETIRKRYPLIIKKVYNSSRSMK